MPTVFIYINPFFTVFETSGDSPPQRWTTGAATEPAALAVDQGDGLWDISFIGMIANGAEPFEAGVDPVFRVFHQNRGVFTGASITTLNGSAVTSCEDPPTVTDSGTALDYAGTALDYAGSSGDDAGSSCDDAGSSCDDAGSSCDDAGTSFHHAQAPTTTIDVSASSTLPETGVGDAARISAPLGLALLLAGVAALGGAALIGDRRRRQ